MTTDFSMTTEQYIEDLKTMNERYDDPMIIKAFEIANRLHNGQMRKSGEPYIIHPIAVSKILAFLAWIMKRSSPDSFTTWWRIRSTLEKSW